MGYSFKWILEHLSQSFAAVSASHATYAQTAGTAATASFVTASNVRFGVSYGNGAFTGTCRILSPSNVSLNVPFDTGSVGTAFLSSTDIAQMGTHIWNIPTANLTGSNTIGARMANASTVDTMGNQLVSLL